MANSEAKTMNTPGALIKRSVLIYMFGAFGPLMADAISEYASRVTLMQKLLFLDHLRIMIKGGLSLVEALKVLERETSNKKLRATIKSISEQVEQGEQLSAALDRFPKIFPSMYVRMIEAGETAGLLESALEQATIQMKKSYDLTSSIRGAMIYPAVILTAMTGIGIMMVTVVLPQLTSLFKEFHATLPLATRVLIAVSDVASQPVYDVLIVLGVAGCIAIYILLMRRVLPFRTAIHMMTLRLPIAGNIIKEINLARFSLTLSSLLKSTIPVVDALNITADTCGNLQYQNALHAGSEVIKRGSPLSDVLQKNPDLFPPMVVEMVLVGEQSGDVESMLTELSQFYNDEVNKTMKNFTAIIEPVIIVFIGLVVGAMAVAVIMPMYSLVQQF